MLPVWMLLYLLVGVLFIRAGQKHTEDVELPIVGIAVLLWPCVFMFGLLMLTLEQLGKLAGGK